MLLYAYAVGVPASREIPRRLQEDVAFRVLAANTTPDFRTLSDFRKQHLEALRGLFVQVLRLCQRAGLVKLGPIALDGTKLKANTWKHKTMSYERMGQEGARVQTEAADARDDARYGADRTGQELPTELAFCENPLQKIREAKAALEHEARAAAAQARPPVPQGVDAHLRHPQRPEAVDPSPAPTPTTAARRAVASERKEAGSVEIGEVASSPGVRQSKRDQAPNSWLTEIPHDSRGSISDGLVAVFAGMSGGTPTIILTKAGERDK